MKLLSINLNFLIFVLIIRDCVTSFCGRQDISCTHQLWDKNSGLPKEACSVKYFNASSPECHLLEFEKSPKPDISFGNVILKSYVTEFYKQTLFEIYFSNITWSEAKIRIAKNVKELQKNMCRTYEIWKNVTVPFDSKLKNNCTFSHSEYEGEDFVFEYELGKPFVYKRFVFQVPFFSNFAALTPLKSHQVFSYVDVTNPEALTLYIQPISLKYNVSQYLVELFTEENNVSTLITDIVLQSKSDLSEQLQFTYPVLEISAEYYFSVAAISSQCDDNVCLKTLTPKIFIRHHKNTWALASCAGALTIGITLSFFTCGLIYFKKRKKKKRNDDTMDYTPVEDEPEEVKLVPEKQFETILNTIDLSGTLNTENEIRPSQYNENIKSIQNLCL